MSKLCVQQLLALIMALVVFSYVTMPRPASAAEAHVLTLSELQQDLRHLQQARTNNLQDIERVLSLPAAQEALDKAHLSTARVTAAIAELNDAELSRLADRARAAEQDVEGGIIIGLLALIGLIVVIVVVLTVVKKND